MSQAGNQAAQIGVAQHFEVCSVTDMYNSSWVGSEPKQVELGARMSSM